MATACVRVVAPSLRMAVLACSSTVRLENLADLPSRPTLRRPGEHFPLAKRKRQPRLGLCNRQLMDSIESIEGYDVNGRIDLSTEVKFATRKRHAGDEPARSVDRHYEAAWKSKVGEEV
jgi:hypothetical protein